MSSVIHKFPLKQAQIFTLEFEESAEILGVQVQNGVPVMWVLLDPDAPKVTHYFSSVLTGKPIEADLRWEATWLATLQLPVLGDDPFVIHVFEIYPETEDKYVLPLEENE